MVGAHLAGGGFSDIFVIFTLMGDDPNRLIIFFKAAETTKNDQLYKLFRRQPENEGRCLQTENKRPYKRGPYYRYKWSYGAPMSRVITPATHL